MYSNSFMFSVNNLKSECNDLHQVTYWMFLTSKHQEDNQPLTVLLVLKGKSSNENLINV